jgi:hypothetical protein
MEITVGDPDDQYGNNPVRDLSSTLILKVPADITSDSGNLGEWKLTDFDDSEINGLMIWEATATNSDGYCMFDFITAPNGINNGGANSSPWNSWTKTKFDLEIIS